MRSGGVSRRARLGNELSGLYHVALLHVELGVVAVACHDAVAVADLNRIAISCAPSGIDDHAVGGRVTVRVVIAVEVDPRVLPAELLRDHVPIRRPDPRSLRLSVALRRDERGPLASASGTRIRAILRRGCPRTGEQRGERGRVLLYDRCRRLASRDDELVAHVQVIGTRKLVEGDHLVGIGPVCARDLVERVALLHGVHHAVDWRNHERLAQMERAAEGQAVGPEHGAQAQAELVGDSTKRVAVNDDIILRLLTGRDRSGSSRNGRRGDGAADARGGIVPALVHDVDVRVRVDCRVVHVGGRLHVDSVGRGGGDHFHGGRLVARDEGIQHRVRSERLGADGRLRQVRGRGDGRDGDHGRVYGVLIGNEVEHPVLGRGDQLGDLALHVEPEAVRRNAHGAYQKPPRGQSRLCERADDLARMALYQNQTAQGGKQNLDEKLFDPECDMARTTSRVNDPRRLPQNPYFVNQFRLIMG